MKNSSYLPVGSTTHNSVVYSKLTMFCAVSKHCFLACIEGSVRFFCNSLITSVFSLNSLSELSLMLILKDKKKQNNKHKFNGMHEYLHTHKHPHSEIRTSVF